MQIFHDKIKNLKAGWNERSLSEDDFYALCERCKIRVQRLPLKVSGFYTCDRKKHYIAIDSRLPTAQATFTMFHEFGHFLMHTPSTAAVSNYCGSKIYRRDETEADAFAYCAMLPLPMLRTREPEELADIFGTTFLMERLSVYERYGI